MLNEKYSFSNDERFFSNFATGFLKEKTIVKIAGKEALGYTVPRKKDYPIEIYVSRDHSIIKSLPNKLVTMFRFGILVHEVLHQVYTNFDEAKKYRSSKYAKLFHLIFNIYEDARIEYHAEQVFGGDAISALELSKEVIFESSKQINENMSDFNQLISALIQIGDAGKYKGCISPKTKECLDRIIVLYSKATKSNSGSECVKLAYESTEIIAEMLLSSDESDEYDLEYDKCNGSGKGKDFDSTDNDETKSNVDSYISDNKKHSGLSENNKSEANNDSSDTEENDMSNGDDASPEDKGCDGNSFNSDSSENNDCNTSRKADEVGEDKSDNSRNGDNITSISEDSSETSSSRCNSTESESAKNNNVDKDKNLMNEILSRYTPMANQLDVMIKELYSAVPDPTREPSVFSCDEHSVVTVKARFDDNYQYDELRSTLAVEINKMASKIARETSTEPERKSHNRKGKINLVRVSNPAYTGTRMFDKKSVKTEHSVAVMIAIDVSGSMSKNKRYIVARSSAVMIAETFAKAKMPVKIIGYSTSGKNPYHIEYVSWKNSVVERHSLMSMIPLKDNMDGISIRCCLADLVKRNEKNKVLIVISDGLPHASGYHGLEAIEDTRNAIKEAKKCVEILGINLLRENEELFSSMYGKNNSICLDDVSELPSLLSNKLKSMSENW